MTDSEIVKKGVGVGGAGRYTVGGGRETMEESSEGEKRNSEILTGSETFDPRGGERWLWGVSR